MKSLKFIIILFFIIIVSCKKENNEQLYPTFYPLPYLPVYPGSYWKYTTNNGDTTLQKTSDNYILHSYNSSELGGIKTDPVYVPYWDGKPIYGYCTPCGYQIPILKTELGASWETSNNISVHVYDCAKTIAVDTNILINGINYDSVIVIKDEHYSYSPMPLSYDKKYYAKNIGLIKEDDFVFNQNTASYDSTNALSIINFHINK
ncbi:MAG TPA: hypothetical protein PKZ43_09670 [Bacteroidales bacterium]|nr:hypothetical protein [Bacteroidales bacterium]HQI46014.1 hypothetical protein [Bacteroidales bacterium]